MVFIYNTIFYTIVFRHSMAFAVFLVAILKFFLCFLIRCSGFLKFCYLRFRNFRCLVTRHSEVFDIL
jgi:hypothetical protein